MRKKKSAEVETARVGLVVGPQEACIVVCEPGDGDRPQIVSWESFPFENPAELQTGLTRFVDSHKLAGAGCRCTISSADYSLRLVERPANVPDNELADATRWLIRDLIEFDVETAGLAILTIPEDSNRARTPKMFVVAARHEPLLDLAHAVDGAGLRLLGFEIVESTLLALEERMPDVVAGGAMLKLEEKQSVLTLSNDSHLYLARNLHIDLATIDDAANRALTEDDPTNPQIIECLDPLLLDVQRSLDYYESEYGLAPASRLILLPSEIDCSPLLPALSEALRPIKVELFDVERNFEFPDSPPADLHQALALAASTTLVHSDVIGVSLLPPTFRPTEGGFGLVSVLKIASAVTALLGLYFGLATYQAEAADSQLAQLDAQRQSLVDQVNANTAKAAAAAIVDPEVEIQALTAKRDARISMFRDMTQRSSRSDASFSNLLAGLARQDLDGLWLERIEFSHGGDALTLEGRALNAGDVPEYLRRLGLESSFEARRFRTFQLERGDGSRPGLGFRIATLSDNSKSGGRDR